MAPHLPLEVLRLIVQHVANEQNEDGQPFKVGSCALVNKVWQVVFEEAIYATVHVRSRSASDTVLVGEERLPKRGLPLEQLERILSQRPARRHAIRRILFRVAIPQWLGEDFRQTYEKEPALYYDPEVILSAPRLYEHSQKTYREYLAGFNDRAKVWKQNDASFSQAIQDLFDVLSSSSWVSTTAIRLSIVLQAEKGPAFKNRREEISPYTGDKEVQYRADFVLNGALPILHCIESVDFPVVDAVLGCRTENAISLSAQSTIAAASNARKAILTERYHVGDADLARNREKLAKTLSLLQASDARTLYVEWSEDLGYNNFFWGHSQLSRGPGANKQMPLQVEIPADPLFYAMHATSMHLREIHLDRMRIAPDIFWPSMQDNVPFWPHLQVFRMTRTPLSMTKDENLCYLYYGLDDSKHPVSMTPTSDLSDPRVPYLANRNKISIIPTFFDELYTAIGRASQRMPRIRHLLLSYGRNGRQELELRASKAGWATLRSYSLYGYSPTKSVLDAWGLEFDQMSLQGGDLVAMWERSAKR